MNERLLMKKLRQAVADYMESAGCGCCGDSAGRDSATAVLGKLLHVPKYTDGSGYDFRKYRTGAEHSERTQP